VTRKSGFVANAALTVFVKFGGLVVGFVVSVLLSRILGPEQRGVFAAVSGVSGLTLQVASFGLQGAFTYYGAREPRWSPGLLRIAVLTGLGSGGVAAATVWAVYAAAPNLFIDLPAIPLAFSLATVPLSLCILYVQNLLLGWGAVLRFNAVDAINKALSTVLVPVWLLISPTVLVAMKATFWVQFLTAFLTVLFALTAIRRPSDPLPPSLKDVYAYGIRGYLNTGLVYLLVRSDILILNYYGVSKVGLGHYSVAAQLVDILVIVPSTVGTLLFSRVAGNQQDTGAFTAKACRLLMVVYCSLVLSAALLAPVAVPFVFGRSYAPAVRFFWLLLPGALGLGIVNPLSQDLAGRGMPWAAVFAWVPPLVVNLAINFLFIPSHGISTAAISSSVAYLLAALIMARLFLARARLSPSVLVPNFREACTVAKQALWHR